MSFFQSCMKALQQTMYTYLYMMLIVDDDGWSKNLSKSAAACDLRYVFAAKKIEQQIDDCRRIIKRHRIVAWDNLSKGRSPNERASERQRSRKELAMCHMFLILFCVFDFKTPTLTSHREKEREC